MTDRGFPPPELLHHRNGEPDFDGPVELALDMPDAADRFAWHMRRMFVEADGGDDGAMAPWHRRWMVDGEGGMRPFAVVDEGDDDDRGLTGRHGHWRDILGDRGPLTDRGGGAGTGVPCPFQSGDHLAGFDVQMGAAPPPFTGAPPIEFQEAPEPGGVGLLAAALVGVLGRRRRGR
jgi:hypothetical protein